MRGAGVADSVAAGSVAATPGIGARVTRTGCGATTAGTTAGGVIDGGRTDVAGAGVVVAVGGGGGTARTGVSCARLGGSVDSWPRRDANPATATIASAPTIAATATLARDVRDSAPSASCVSGSSPTC